LLTAAVRFTQGGAFTSFSPNGGTTITRNRLAGLNINTGIPTDWNPNSGGTINSILVGTSGVYAGGGFSTIGGVSRTNFAAFPITAVEWGGISGGSWNQASNRAPGIVPGSTIAQLGQRANALKSILSFVSENCIDQLN
jgi:hypothetical protein